MVSDTGHVKVLDFGLAKLIDRVPDGGAATATSSLASHLGIVMGTPAYMSPEQARGIPVDGKSDVFSFGAMLYEMLAGRRPFSGDTPLGTLTAIIGQDPPSLKTLRAHLPTDLARLTHDCLQKDPASRPTARDVALRLEAIRLKQGSTWMSVRRLLGRPTVALPLSALLFGAVGLAWWWWSANARIRWARTIAIPEIQRLANESEFDRGFRLAHEALAVLPDDPQLKQLWLNVTVVASIRTEPASADVAIKSYRSDDASWYSLGRTPLENIRVPFGAVRLRFSKEGFETIEVSGGGAAVFGRG